MRWSLRWPASQSWIVLSDIQNNLTRSLTEGMSFRQFQDELELLLQRKGWLGRGLVADDDGVLHGKKADAVSAGYHFSHPISSRRMAAGRYQWMVANAKERPYWQYNAIMDGRTRPAHRSPARAYIPLGRSYLECAVSAEWL
ncbi:Phage (Mu-like) virion morphogenesis protein [Enterobacter cancerogenus]|uniref:Phage (Mu-like) virion morphogenesis protein n=1 Tax=Enterobacter cancerogenus TaxID=69218 RepID=A0A484ZAX5_9ENTR|nr:Phage (Mu-like) virion morphogenesis protein [Enterobacter cancerogenus]